MKTSFNQPQPLALNESGTLLPGLGLLLLLLIIGRASGLIGVA